MPLNPINEITLFNRASDPMTKLPNRRAWAKATPRERKIKLEPGTDYFTEWKGQMYRVDSSFRSKTPLPMPAAILSTGEWVKLVPINRGLTAAESVRFLPATAEQINDNT